jgi:predicted nucleic acid-binding protein
MIVIADTTHINHLVLLGRAETLQQLYGRVIVPGRGARRAPGSSRPAGSQALGRQSAFMV